MTDDPNRPPPPGFERHARRSGFTNPWEPIYAKRSEASFGLGVWVGEAHVNGRGFAHGGLISALADNAMGLSCVEHIRASGGDAAGLVTVNLSVDFAGSAQIGQWLDIRPEMIKGGKSLYFVSALVFADDQVCARASAVFKIAVVSERSKS